MLQMPTEVREHVRIIRLEENPREVGARVGWFGVGLLVAWVCFFEFSGIFWF